VMVRSAEMRLSHPVINFLAHPNIAYMLLVAGVVGLIVELATPGISVAGVGGILCLLLALTALQALPINVTGLVFILLAVGLWIAKASVPGLASWASVALLPFCWGR